MSRTTGRTLALLGLLQAHREWSGAELRARLDISARTLRRDIEDLRALGYGIDAIPGVGGGYRLGIGASIPPLVLSADEAVAIAVGLRAAASATVTGIEDAAARALVKLEQSLSNETRERITAMGHAIVPLGSAGEVDLETVVTIARAIRESRTLRIDYRRHDGTEVRRSIEPHRIVHTGTRWYVVARDPEPDRWRTFRLDRLTPLLPLAGPFIAQEIPDDAVREFTTRSITSAPYPHRFKVRMHAPVTEVAAHFGPSIAQVTAIDDQSCELESGSNSPDEFALYLGMTGIDFDVIDGEDLRATLAELSTRFSRASTHKAAEA